MAKLQALFFLLLVAFAVFFSSATAPESKGERLAKAVCASCHLFPEPALLPAAVWDKIVLPQMGYQLGIYPTDSFRLKLIAQSPGGAYLLHSGLFPVDRALSAAEWEQICDYYRSNAPDTLKCAEPLPINMGMPQFRTRTPDWRLSPPSTTMIRFQPKGELWIGDANTRKLYVADDSLRLLKAAGLAEGVVDIQPGPGGVFVTLMGSFSPTDEPSGSVIFLRENTSIAQLLIEDLQRPVSCVWDDFNRDGRLDAVVCAYAKWTGGLSYHQQEADGNFTKQILRSRPGAIRSYVRDFNRDGLPDVIALFGQGDEGIFRYINLGGGNFREETVLRFPPTYGSSNFRLSDVDGDQLEDIIYTCGDNADYKPVLKPYHGARIFKNNGRGEYAEKFFLPLNGAYDAVFEDFDQDGDLDIAAISFFPDFSARPEEAFLYFENTGRFQFVAHTFPEVNLGRWIVMDVGDLEGDGDLDIALGSLTFEVTPDRGEIDRWLKNKLPFLVLENTLINKKD